MPLYPSCFLMLRCAKTEWSPHYLEASSEYCESFHETSLSALVLDVVNLLYNFIEVTLRRYSTLLPLSAAVKEQNWKQKSPLEWLFGLNEWLRSPSGSDWNQCHQSAVWARTLHPQLRGCWFSREDKGRKILSFRYINLSTVAIIWLFPICVLLLRNDAG